MSYSLPAYRPGDYARAADWISDLKQLGFRCVTFTPTYLVHDEIPLRIEPERSPSFEELARAAGFAAEAGLAVQVDPHLDWKSTLTGGPYEWRRRMYFDPSGPYFEQVLAPVTALLTATGSGQATLTLGSELDVSLVEFSHEWSAVADAIRKLAPGVSLTHKLNGDSLDKGESIRTDLNRERARRTLPEASRSDYLKLVRNLSAYLSELDAVSFSFYPPVPREGDAAKVFAFASKKLASKLRASAGTHPRFSIGEFGLGSMDTTRPWEFDQNSFLGPDGSITAAADQTRRRYYKAFLEALETSLTSVERATFWTVAQYDFLGVCGNDTFRDEQLRDAVRAYNEGQSDI